MLQEALEAIDPCDTNASHELLRQASLGAGGLALRGGHASPPHRWDPAQGYQGQDGAQRSRRQGMRRRELDGRDSYLSWETSAEHKTCVNSRMFLSTLHLDPPMRYSRTD
jgi:hypothetical protein